jgi:hypothetical protein
MSRAVRARLSIINWGEAVVLRRLYQKVRSPPIAAEPARQRYVRIGANSRVGRRAAMGAKQKAPSGGSWPEAAWRLSDSEPQKADLE